MAGNGYVSARNVLDALDREKEAEKLQKELQAARAKVAVENYNARQTANRSRDGGTSRAARAQVAAAQTEVKELTKQLETVTGVSNSDRVGLTASGAITGMGASYVGAGGTLLKGADMAVRSTADSDILTEEGQTIAKQYAARQTTHAPTKDNSAYGEARAAARAAGNDLKELKAKKEAEALEKQLGLMKAASALDAEYEHLARRSAKDIARAKLGASGTGKFAIDATVAGAQVAADAAANALVPGAGLALKGVRSFGDASQEARRAGASVGQQVVYGALTAGKDVVIEKTFDGLGGTYGKGIYDKVMKSPQVKEATEAALSTMVQPALESIYNEKNLRDNYNIDVLADALQNAAIKGITSGAISAFADAKNLAIINAADAVNKASETSLVQQRQATIRKNYVGSAQHNAEGYASLIKALLNAKGNGQRW